MHHALVAWCCWNKKTDVHRLLELYPVEMMRICLTARDVSEISGRELSTIRRARANGRVKGIRTKKRYLYSLYDLITGFRPVKNVRRKWSLTELSELQQTGKCATRSTRACKVMLSKLNNKEKYGLSEDNL